MPDGTVIWFDDPQRVRFAEKEAGPVFLCTICHLSSRPETHQ